MNVRFYSFSKRPNSTKQPSSKQGKNVECQLKDETSFLNPVLKISPSIVTGVFSPDLYNYAEIEYWQRYYYITDWTYINGVWECSLVVDPMASFKSEIGNTSTYVIRSASNYNGTIVDSFYPTTTQMSITRQQISSEIWRTTLPGGCYVVGCISSQGTNKVGAVSYYALTDAQMGSLLEYLFSSNIYNNSNIYEIGQGLYQSLFNPFQYVASCMWFPFPASTMGNSTANIKVGYWDTEIKATVVRYIVDDVGFKTNLPITRHPQADSRGEYLNHAPYTTVTAYYPPFGEIPIDTMHLQYGNNNYLHGNMVIDFITGIADCYFAITNGYGGSADPYKYFTMRTAQLGVPIQLTQITSDYLNTLTSGLGAVSSGFSGNIAGIFGNIANAVSSLMPKVSSLGANGSFVEILAEPQLIVEHLRLVDEDLAEFGRPLCAIKTIKNLSGYIQCGNSDHAFSCTKTESEEINRYMKEGFFYE